MSNSIGVSSWYNYISGFHCCCFLDLQFPTDFKIFIVSSRGLLTSKVIELNKVSKFKNSLFVMTYTSAVELPKFMNTKQVNFEIFEVKTLSRPRLFITDLLKDSLKFGLNEK